MLENWLWPVVFYQVCPNIGPSSQNVPAAGAGFGPQKLSRNLLLLNHFQGCGIPMPDLSDSGHFASRQADFSRATEFWIQKIEKCRISILNRQKAFKFFPLLHNPRLKCVNTSSGSIIILPCVRPAASCQKHLLLIKPAL